MAERINRAIELLAQDQAIYYTGGHSGHVLSRAQGREDAHTWADYINVGMEHGAFDMTGLAEYMAGLAEAGPTRSGHPHPGGHRRGSGQRHRRRQCPLQRLAVPPDPRPRRARHLAVPGRVGRRGARLCRSLPLPAPPGRGRPRPALPGRAHARRGAAGDRRARSASAPAAAARRRRRRRSGGSRPRNTSRAASRGRSIPPASCCSGSSSNCPRGSPIARRSSPSPASALPNSARATSACRSATSRSRASPTRRR